ncbi:hypothetical protein [Vibrio crassostreae]|uniref:hypothetical protein n=1 Tax=Vibrio crassostreae TaxID=246167 RepID=UPI001046BDBE|nr:hypothetical protein [Vibrio crassostreae]TCT78867.1 hypothetical protein EDB46_101437 [Vibrio crassostreae]CAK1880100.1 conserved hypothetical protein [Vibrio crassostreae]CAK2439924.1 conserved hypothetical protein [Vibrio crassostreae]CAK2823447.1 conserved hypothetical protein [Vibrio crassostreae]
MSGLDEFHGFLDNTPPYTELTIAGIFNEPDIQDRKKRLSMGLKDRHASTSLSKQITPSLYCSGEGCKSYQYFTPLATSSFFVSHPDNQINKLEFRCKNCEQTVKTFYILFDVGHFEGNFPTNETPITIQKVGEFPRFGKQAPNQVSKLIGSERDHFFKGTICENMGMGIAAFSYYRRVIDARKNNIFDKIIKVLELNKETNRDLIQELSEAKEETQFTNAVGKIKHALPESLTINGQNPLTLLYSALSEGLHVHSDEECLQYAQAIKLVLFELVDRLDSSLREDKALLDAVKLLSIKTGK